MDYINEKCKNYFQNAIESILIKVERKSEILKHFLVNFNKICNIVHIVKINKNVKKTHFLKIILKNIFYFPIIIYKFKREQQEWADTKNNK